MDILSPYKEGNEVIIEVGGEPLKLCYQCGLCTGNCPWNLVRRFDLRKMIHEAQLGIIDFSKEEVWLCASCNACVENCPRGVKVIDIMQALRRAVVTLGIGNVPDALKMSIKNIDTTGNPLAEPSDDRENWAKDLGVKIFSPGTELLYFVGCIPSYDNDVKKVAQSTAKILTNLGIDFGILGNEEKCCGESVRKAGYEDIFQKLATVNIHTFNNREVNTIVVSSPHCYHTFINEYPELGGKFQVLHITQYLAQLIEQGVLKFSKELKKKVIYSDPCYLGRHSKIYDEPRKVLNAIPGLELIEFPDSEKNALCCGGGGGRIWMETVKGERFSDTRVAQAITCGAEVISVACPYCYLTYRDSLLTANKLNVIEIKDVVELVAEAM